MIPVAALAADPSTLVFKGSLERRPIEPLLKSLRDLGANAHTQKTSETARDAVFVEGGGILGGETSIAWRRQLPIHFGINVCLPNGKSGHGNHSYNAAWIGRLR